MSIDEDYASESAVTRGHRRRDVLRLAGAAGLGVAAAVQGVPAWAATPTGSAEPIRDYARRDSYDWAEQYFYENGNASPDRLNEQGGLLAWGQSHVLRSYMMMYSAFGDSRYLDRLVRNADRILANRNHARGVSDYSGIPNPLWRSWHPYTAGGADLRTDGLVPIVRIRCASRYVNDVKVTVSNGSTPDTFTLVVDHPRITVETFSDLCMDPDAENYVVRRLFNAAPTRTNITAVDLRTTPYAGDKPRTGRFALRSYYYDMAVDSGMICAAIAEFVATVRSTPALHATYGHKALEYLDAVESAVAVFDNQWRQNSRGEGWYVAPRGAPILFDGSELPHNQYLVLAITQLHLFRATGRRMYRDRSRRMFTTFKNDLVKVGDRYSWTYWWTKGTMGRGYTQADDISDYTPAQGPVRTIEDVSHGAIQVWAAVEAHRNGMVFTANDLVRFGRTFLTRIAQRDPNGKPTVTARIDGSGALGTYDRPAGLWAVLTPWCPQIHPFLRDVYNANQFVVEHGYTLASIAALAAHAKRPDR